MTRILARHQRNWIRLKEQERALVAKTDALAETHTTLKILLQTRREERRKLAARLHRRFRDVLLPVVKGLGDTDLTPCQAHQAEFVRDIIMNIIPSPLSGQKLSALELTPRETLTAYLVARGCTTRDAARVLNTSPRTIECYRAGIRRKARLEGTGLRLNQWLRSESQTRPRPSTGP
ncbi:MAG: response regulator transcription factor, partial [Desulfosarcina sp.]|nr:response regulator transcription factor [Desulfobacterales bacterium]